MNAKKQQPTILKPTVSYSLAHGHIPVTSIFPNFCGLKNWNLLIIWPEIGWKRNTHLSVQNHQDTPEKGVKICSKLKIKKTPEKRQSRQSGVFSVNIKLASVLKLFLWSSRSEVFYRKGVLKNFTKFTEKHMCHCLFSNKLQT